MSNLLRKSMSAALTASRSASTAVALPKVAGREVVGYGYNGDETYVDRVDFPMPALRFGALTPAVKELREREKGDWKKLSIAEKKALYRASFCQTFAEINAPDGEWKSIWGFSLCAMSLALWVLMFFKTFVYTSELPETFSEEHQKAQLQRMIDLRVNPIEGISSHWDYEKNAPKK